MNGLEDQKHIQRIAAWWSGFGPPIRPGRETLARIAAETSQAENPRVLILGSTPEVVDLFLKQKAGKIAVMDLSEYTVRAMESLGSEDWKRVRKIIADWRTPVGDLMDSFNIVSGDSPFSMIPYPGEWETIFHNLSGYLVPGGRIILRNLFSPTVPFVFQTYLEEVLDRFRNMDRKKHSMKDFVSEIRLGTLLGAADPRGIILPEIRLRLRREALQRLTPLAENRGELEIIESLLGAENEKMSLRAASAPHRKDVADLLRACGFMVRSFQAVADRPCKDALFVMTAMKHGTDDRPGPFRD